MHYGDTTVLSTCTASAKPRDGIDFFPLSVEYEEKMYSVGKFPGGFKKREGRASDNAILTARVIDRPMRPLFPKDYRNDVLLNNLVLSVDQDASPELLAMLGSSLSTCLSDVPFDGPCATTQIGMVGGEFVVNPGNGEKAVSDLLLTVASTKEKVIMIEAGANELPEDKMIEAIYLAHDVNQQIIGFFESIIEECGKEKHSYVSSAIPEELFAKMKEVVKPEEMEKAVFTDDKAERDANVSLLSERLVEAFQDDEEALAILPDAIYQYEKKTVRKMILKDHKRPDGRAIDEIRKLEAEVDLLPRVHGSAMFKRGQTQIMNITTLAPLSEVQKVEGLNEFETEKRYLHQYNFPGYSVGEAKASRGPGRREIGHGALAEKALIPVLPSVEEFPYAIRSVSETMESNGSTSMASTCASCMSLMAAGVPIKKPVAGISCGLVTGDSDDEYLVLTDIQGLEDFFGDMDFKVTGTEDGITAIQMDIKIHGLTRPIVEEAIRRAREARLFIMNGVMKEAIAEPRAELSPYAPKILTMSINPEKIGDVIGKQGKTINGIIEETGVKIDIDDNGTVSISGTNLPDLERAKKIIESIVNDIEPGQIFEGTVVRMMDFGAFVQLSPNKDGMIHISKLSDQRVNKVEDVVHIGDKVRVKGLEGDKMGSFAYSLYIYRLQACISQMIASMGGVDALVFTATIGERSDDVRRQVIQKMKYLGLELDAEKNTGEMPERHTLISKDESKPVYVVRTDETSEMIERANLILAE